MKKAVCFGMVICLFFGMFTAKASEAETIIQDTADYLISAVPEPSTGTTSGEWLVFALARGECNVPEGYFERYYQNLCSYVFQKKGVLHERKYTEYARVVLALTAIGRNPEVVGEYNLLEPLADFEKVVWQGLNGPIFALLALDSKPYDMPVCASANVQATRQMYVDYILSSQLESGGFSLTGEGEAEPDITAMAVTALAKYKTQPLVWAAIEKAVAYLSGVQNETAGFSVLEAENIESSAQVLVMLAALNISVEDSRFVKNGKTVLDSLMAYSIPDGGFAHTKDSSISNQMSGEQALYALAAQSRYKNGKTALYDMQDVTLNTKETPSGDGLPGKDARILKKPVVFNGKTFADIQGAAYQQEVEALAARNIINGKTEADFEPNASMTRAEFAAIMVKALGLPLAETDVFQDVQKSDWFYSFVASAHAAGIIQGVSESEFEPGGTITKEEAAVMTARAAVLCGLNTSLNDVQILNILAQFTDYRAVQQWAKEAMAFCYGKDILLQSDIEILPEEPVKRFEIACMLYQLLNCALLL